MFRPNWRRSLFAPAATAALLLCACSPSPPKPALRDTIVFDGVAYQDFLDGLSYNPNARLYLNEQKLAYLAATERERATLKTLAAPLRAQRPFAPSPVRLSASQGAVRDIITRVSLDHGLDPSFFHALAHRESRYDYLAGAPTSSARGLFQFTQNTWLCALHTYGADYGVADAAYIVLQPSGECTVSDAHIKARLLGMRYDPSFSTNIAIEHTLANRDFLVQHHHSVTKADLYALHFFGQSDGWKFLTANPLAYADSITPKAAAANRAIFYDRGRRKRVVEVYNSFYSL